MLIFLWTSIQVRSWSVCVFHHMVITYYYKLIHELFYLLSRCYQFHYVLQKTVFPYWLLQLCCLFLLLPTKGFECKFNLRLLRALSESVDTNDNGWVEWLCRLLREEQCFLLCIDIRYYYDLIIGVRTGSAGLAWALPEKF